MAHADDYKTKIEELRLNVRRVNVLPKASNDISQTLSRTTTKYPIRRVKVNTFTISTVSHPKIEDHVFQGELPKGLFMGIVSNEASKDSSPPIPSSFKITIFPRLEPPGTVKLCAPDLSSLTLPRRITCGLSCHCSKLRDS